MKKSLLWASLALALTLPAPPIEPAQANPLVALFRIVTGGFIRKQATALTAREMAAMAAARGTASLGSRSLARQAARNSMPDNAIGTAALVLMATDESIAGQIQKWKMELNGTDGEKQDVIVPEGLYRLMRERNVQTLWFSDRANKVQLAGYNPNPNKVFMSVGIYIEDAQTQQVEATAPYIITCQPADWCYLNVSLEAVPLGLKRVTAVVDGHPEIKIQPSGVIAVVPSEAIEQPLKGG